jgi:hypothetical protein
VFFLFPGKDGEQRLLERYAAEDAAAPSGGDAVVTVDEDPVDHVHT